MAPQVRRAEEECKMTRVVIIYGRKLEKILIDSNVEIDVSSIAEKPVQEWFAPQEDRSGWRGLIEEIRAAVADDGAELNFEFQGPKEYKAIFEACLKEHGIFSSADGLDNKTLIEETLYEAERLDHRGSYKMALEKYEAVGNMGHPQAQFQAGEYYRKGVGCEADMERAADWYEKAAKQRYAPAEYQLGDCYDEGNGVKKDRKQAADWYRKAAEQGYAYGSRASFHYRIMVKQHGLTPRRLCLQSNTHACCG